MSQTVIVHGRYAGRTFIPDSPLPDAEGVAELVEVLPHCRGIVVFLGFDAFLDRGNHRRIDVGLRLR